MFFTSQILMHRAYKKQRSFKNTRNNREIAANNQKETADIYLKSRLWEFNLNKADWNKAKEARENQGETYLIYLCKQIAEQVLQEYRGVIKLQKLLRATKIRSCGEP